MKLRKTLLLGVAALSLGACSNIKYGTKIAYNEFVQEALKCEEKEYTSAVFSYSYSQKSTSTDIGQKPVTFKESGEYTFTFKDGEFVKDDNQKESLVDVISSFGMIVGMSAKESATSETGGSIDNGVMTFYKEPLGMKVETTNTYGDSFDSIVAKSSKYIEFDENSYTKKAVITETIKSVIKTNNNVITYTSTIKKTTTINISYK